MAHNFFAFAITEISFNAIILSRKCGHTTPINLPHIMYLCGHCKCNNSIVGKPARSVYLYSRLIPGRKSCNILFSYILVESNIYIYSMQAWLVVSGLQSQNTHTHTYKHTYTHTQTHIYTHKHTYIHIQTHTNTYKHTHKHTYTHIHILEWNWSNSIFQFNVAGSLVQSDHLTCKWTKLLSYFLYNRTLYENNS